MFFSARHDFMAFFFYQIICRIVSHAASSAATGFVERVLLISKSCRVICRDRFCNKGTSHVRFLSLDSNFTRYFSKIKYILKSCVVLFKNTQKVFKSVVSNSTIYILYNISFYSFPFKIIKIDLQFWIS